MKLYVCRIGLPIRAKVLPMCYQSGRGLYCLRCASRKVVRGHLGESARFCRLRNALRWLLGKPVFLNNPHSHACMACEMRPTSQLIC